MAIYSSVPPPDQQGPSLTTPAPALVASLPIRGTNGVTLSIPLDATDEQQEKKVRARKEPLRRDSLKRREALLRGKEGSRRRQRWENDRLLHVPNAQPPLPSDWAAGPTYPVHSVPYYLAPLWDLRSESKAAPKSKPKSGSDVEAQKGRVPSELKAKLKKSKGAKTLLQELEMEVRTFVREYEAGLQSGEKDKGEEAMVDSEDEEIVFVGRNGGMSDVDRERVERVLEREKKVWESLEGESGGGFGRWLVHSIAAYYGLSSRSITVGNPARREAYVGIKETKMKTGRAADGGEMELPRPLWGLV